MRNMSKKTWKLRVWNRMTEMQKLDILLTKAAVPHVYDNAQRWRKSGEQIIVLDYNGKRIWDAVWCEGTYGYEQGLLEVMGPKFIGRPNVIEGWLTARQIMKMWGCKNAAQNR